MSSVPYARRSHHISLPADPTDFALAGDDEDFPPRRVGSSPPRGANVLDMDDPDFDEADWMAWLDVFGADLPWTMYAGPGTWDQFNPCPDRSDIRQVVARAI